MYLLDVGPYNVVNGLSRGYAAGSVVSDRILAAIESLHEEWVAALAAACRQSPAGESWRGLRYIRILMGVAVTLTKLGHADQVLRGSQMYRDGGGVGVFPFQDVAQQWVPEEAESVADVASALQRIVVAVEGRRKPVRLDS